MNDTNMNTEEMSTAKHSSNLFAKKTMVKVVYDEIAIHTSLNESIMLGQINYWLQKSQDEKHYRDGHYWIWKTYDEWEEELPFWSKSTIRNIIRSLKNRKLIIIGNYNKMSVDKTSWYTIDYDALEELCNNEIPDKKSSKKYEKGNIPCVKVEQSMCQSLTHGATKFNTSHVSKFNTPITIEYPEHPSGNPSRNTKEWSDFDEIKMRPPDFRLRERLKSLFDYDNDFVEKMEDVISYFFKEYEYLNEKPHEYIVSDKHFYEPTMLIGTVAYELDYDAMTNIVDQYFNDFPDTVWDYRHFGTDGILRRRMLELSYGQGVVDGILGKEV